MILKEQCVIQVSSDRNGGLLKEEINEVERVLLIRSKEIAA